MLRRGRSFRPHLENGDVMTREEYHLIAGDDDRYERAERIEGIVYLPSPIPYRHAEAQADNLRLVHGIYQ